ncbi:partial cytochrome c-type protein NapB, partial [Candidatus Brocadiaceae bacterium]
MNKIIFMLIALLFSIQTYATDEAARKTLKEGNTVLKELSPIPEIKKWRDDDEGIPKQFPQQPPLIPHITKGYVLNLKANKCLTCHSRENAGESGA